MYIFIPKASVGEKLGFLSVAIDHTLLRSEHVKNIRNKVAKRTEISNRARKVLSESTLHII